MEGMDGFICLLRVLNTCVTEIQYARLLSSCFKMSCGKKRPVHPYYGTGTCRSSGDEIDGSQAQYSRAGPVPSHASKS